MINWGNFLAPMLAAVPKLAANAAPKCVKLAADVTGGVTHSQVMALRVGAIADSSTGLIR